MNKGKAQKDILYISISIFVVVALWIGFNLYHAYVTSTIAPDLQTQTDPINPVFNTAVIQKLKSRQKINPVFELNSASSAASPSPTPSTGNSPSPAISQALTQPPTIPEGLPQ